MKFENLKLSVLCVLVDIRFYGLRLLILRLLLLDSELLFYLTGGLTKVKESSLLNYFSHN